MICLFQKETPNLPSPGLTKVEFEISVPMVTYLACFIVCDFDYVEIQTAAKKPFRVYSTKDQVYIYVCVHAKKVFVLQFGRQRSRGVEYIKNRIILYTLDRNK